MAMERLLEPAPAQDQAEALVRAEADLAGETGELVRLFGELFGAEPPAGFALHLGCRSGESSLRFARACPGCAVHAVDRSAAMIEAARAALAVAPQLDGRVRFIEGALPGAPLPRTRYDLVLADGLLHRMEDPQVLWNVVRRHGVAGAPVLIRDLRRPVTHAEAIRLVQRHAAAPPESVRRALINSLHAAFESEEIRLQLLAARLSGFQVRPLGALHVVVWGRLAPGSLIGA